MRRCWPWRRRWRRGRRFRRPTGTADPEERANRVADIALRGRLPEPAPRPERSSSAGDSRAVAGFAGVYWNAERMLVARLARHEKGLAVMAGATARLLERASDGLYRVGNQPVRYRFIDGTPRRVERVPVSGDPLVLVGQDAWTPSAEDLDRYAGTFYSDELQARWQVARDGPNLVVRNLRAPARVLAPAFRDVFTSNGLVVCFEPAQEPASGFAVGAGRARGMRFSRVVP